MSSLCSITIAKCLHTVCNLKQIYSDFFSNSSRHLCKHIIPVQLIHSLAASTTIHCLSHSLFLPLRGDFVQLSALNSAPQAVVPNLYLSSASSLSPCLVFVLYRLLSRRLCPDYYVAWKSCLTGSYLLVLFSPSSSSFSLL